MTVRRLEGSDFFKVGLTVHGLTIHSHSLNHPAADGAPLLKYFTNNFAGGLAYPKHGVVGVMLPLVGGNQLVPKYSRIGQKEPFLALRKPFFGVHWYFHTWSSIFAVHF
jgi:hypothetical protein